MTLYRAMFCFGIYIGSMVTFVATVLLMSYLK
jgi:hypothetical protein